MLDVRRVDMEWRDASRGLGRTENGHILFFALHISYIAETWQIFPLVSNSSFPVYRRTHPSR
ncbi:predicted protein [Botrytis cinerea T4]|uniref:Uncharacterized protein n=1 Tax=Botryotinia fuckeliana (strain T4) TaxID=999810 RepID=G2XZE2_BOTF4|nr:predicted protein [Botrytis cinerea T4]